MRLLTRAGFGYAHKLCSMKEFGIQNLYVLVL